jgi:hypothetical protein
VIGYQKVLDADSDSSGEGDVEGTTNGNDSDELLRATAPGSIKTPRIGKLNVVDDMDEFDDIKNLDEIFAVLCVNNVDDLFQIQDTENLLKT